MNIIDVVNRVANEWMEERRILLERLENSENELARLRAPIPVPQPDPPQPDPPQPDPPQDNPPQDYPPQDNPPQAEPIMEYIGRPVPNHDTYRNLTHGEEVKVLRYHSRARYNNIGPHHLFTVIKNGNNLIGFRDRNHNIIFKSPSAICCHYFRTTDGRERTFDGPTFCFVTRNNILVNIKNA